MQGARKRLAWIPFKEIRFVGVDMMMVDPIAYRPAEQPCMHACMPACLLVCACTFIHLSHVQMEA